MISPPWPKQRCRLTPLHLPESASIRATSVFYDRARGPAASSVHAGNPTLFRHCDVISVNNPVAHALSRRHEKDIGPLWSARSATDTVLVGKSGLKCAGIGTVVHVCSLRDAPTGGPTQGSYILYYTDGMGDTITFRPDEDASRALEVLTKDGTPVSTAVRTALIDAARRLASVRLRAEAEELAADEQDRAEAAQVLRDMETLRAW